jgi:hypothetical protein
MSRWSSGFSRLFAGTAADHEYMVPGRNSNGSFLPANYIAVRQDRRVYQCPQAGPEALVPLVGLSPRWAAQFSAALLSPLWLQFK